MEFPWRCNVDTIAMDLKVSWEMSVNIAFQYERKALVGGGRRAGLLTAFASAVDENLYHCAKLI